MSEAPASRRPGWYTRSVSRNDGKSLDRNFFRHFCSPTSYNAVVRSNLKLLMWPWGYDMGAAGGIPTARVRYEVDPQTFLDVASYTAGGYMLTPIRVWHHVTPASMCSEISADQSRTYGSMYETVEAVEAYEYFLPVRVITAVMAIPRLKHEAAWPCDYKNVFLATASLFTHTSPSSLSSTANLQFGCSTICLLRRLREMN